LFRVQPERVRSQRLLFDLDVIVYVIFLSEVPASLSVEAQMRVRIDLISEQLVPDRIVPTRRGVAPSSRITIVGTVLTA
jgi:hypothetical protein